MPGIWRLHCTVDGPVVVQPQFLRGLASNLFDVDRPGHDDIKPWSIGEVSLDERSLTIDVGVVDHRLSDIIARATKRDDLTLGRSGIHVESVEEIAFMTWPQITDDTIAVDLVAVRHRTAAATRLRVGPDRIQVTNPVLFFDVLVESWRNRWNATRKREWGPIELAPSLDDLTSSIVHLDGHTESFEIDHEPFVGIVGEIHHRILTGSDESRRWLHRLARLAIITGTGARTSAGAGVTDVHVSDEAAPRALPRRGSPTRKSAPRGR